MSGERTDYPGLLQRVQPARAVDILNDRVSQVKRLNTNIADWLQERSKLEEQYANGLRRLARKHIGEDDLGIFSVPWGTLTSSMETLAESHSSLASKIDVDIEKPLRDFASQNREVQAMTTIQGNLASMAKDVEKAQQKTEKLAGKGDKAETNKVANASSDLGEARAQWDSQAPYVFENLQALDESRVNQLRDLLTQFVTLEVDQLEKSRVPVEQSLNVLLNVETADEIKTFALKALSSRPSENQPRPNRASMFVGSSSTPSRGGQSTGLNPVQSNPDEAQSQHSTPEPQKKGAFKGLKRLGTVMSRRQSKQPQQLSTTSESPERKSRGLNFGRLGRNKDSYSLDPPQEEPESASQRPRSPLRMGSEALEPPQSRQESSSSRPPQLDPIPRLNGAGSGDLVSSPAQPYSSAIPNSSHQGDLADLDPPKPLQAPQVTVPQVAEPPRDSEGFSVPHQGIDPISAAQAEAAAAGERAEPAYNVNIRSAPIQEEGGDAALASVANKLSLPPPTARRAGTVRGRRDARNSAIINTHGAPDQSSSPEISGPAPPVQRIETLPSATAYPPPVQQPSLQPPAHTRDQIPVQPPALSTGLVASPSGAFSPSASAPATFSAFNPVGEPQSPIRAHAPLSIDHTGDNQSIRSGRSLQSTASHALKHPELQQPGLNSSIIETVSARFENGQAVSSSLIGEIALVFNPADVSTSLGHETIRLDNFAGLDKVAPNPAFIGQEAGREGEYSVNFAGITRPQIAFKYQLRQEQAATQTPLLITPAFRIEPNQAMVIVSYSLHRSFVLQGRDSLTLSNVTIALTLEGAKASSCQSKPVGTFAREKNLIFWQLNDITLRPGSAPEKLLARFATDTEATGGHVESRWEIAGGVGSGLAVSLHVNEGADPFADESAAGSSAGNWKPVPSQRRIVSGQYTAKS